MPDPMTENAFERWVYPTRCYDLAQLTLTSPLSIYEDLRSLFSLYWPTETLREDLDILVAGCGSLQAAAQAYAYPNSRVVGIDINRANLEHAESLKRKHDLTNLTLRQLPIEDAITLGAEFDFILCHGVLHHLTDPIAGLRALGQVLRPNGVIDIAVHAKYGRLGVTMLQELFRAMGLKQDGPGVQTVRDVLASLPPTHPVQPYRRVSAQELATDEGLVNTFLSERDRPIPCSECLDLVQHAGLVFQGWKENGLYYPDIRVPAGDRLWPHLRTLTERRLWQTLEIYDATISTHRFHVCRADRDPATYRIQFDDDAFLDYIPVGRISQTVAASKLRRQPGFIARPPLPPMLLDDGQAAIVKQIDGVRSVRACLAAAGVPVETPADIASARNFFSSLWRAGYAMFRLPVGA